MSTEKNTEEKTRLHIRNKNRENYNLEALIKVEPDLGNHIRPNKYGNDSVDFANPEAVKLLNKAILNHYYGIKNWDFPEDNLVPPIPGRADYLHYMADLLSQSNFGPIPRGEQIIGLDVGVGANCIYPIIGATEYGWRFIGSDTEPMAVESAQKIVEANLELKDKVTIRLQENNQSFFAGIISEDEKVDFTLCNPPFHSSQEEAREGTKKKLRNLKGKKVKTPDVALNFAGINSELVYEGGESTFIHDMILESEQFAKNSYWFSTLVSKKSNLKGIYKTLGQLEVTQVKTIPMGTGNKSTRIIAWTFLDKEEQKEWRETRWKAVSTDEETKV